MGILSIEKEYINIKEMINMCLYHRTNNTQDIQNFFNQYNINLDEYLELSNEVFPEWSKDISSDENTFS